MKAFSILFLIAAITAALQSCSKSSGGDGTTTPVKQGVTITTAHFTTDQDNYYLGQTVTVTADQTNAGNNKYYWFNGSNYFTGNASFSLAFTIPGVYLIELSLGNYTYSKHINIRGYNASYQIKNGCSTAILQGFRDHLVWNGAPIWVDTTLSKTLNPGQMTDTIFVVEGTFYHPTYLQTQFHLFTPNDSGPWQATCIVNYNTHTIFTIKDTTTLVQPTF